MKVERLCQELVEINDKICDLRPVPVIEDENDLEQMKKTADAFRQDTEEEINRLIGRVLRDRQQLGHLDLESTEMAIRAAMHQMGGLLLAKLLNGDGGGYCGTHIGCGQGHQAASGMRFLHYPQICRTPIGKPGIPRFHNLDSHNPQSIRFQQPTLTTLSYLWTIVDTSDLYRNSLPMEGHCSWRSAKRSPAVQPP